MQLLLELGAALVEACGQLALAALEQHVELSLHPGQQPLGLLRELGVHLAGVLLQAAFDGARFFQAHVDAVEEFALAAVEVFE